MSGKVYGIVGATGAQGGSVISGLLSEGVEGKNIIALTRNVNSDKAKSLGEKGVKLVQGDLNDINSLEGCFDGCDSVFIVTDFWASAQMNPTIEIEQGKNIGDVLAKTKSVKHVVFSALEDSRVLMSNTLKPLNGSMTVPHLDTKGVLNVYYRDILRLPVTLYYTAFYMENLFGMLAPQKGEDGTLTYAMPMGDVPLAMVTVADIGLGVARILTQGPDKWSGKEFFVVSDVLPLSELTKKLSKASGKTFKYYPIDADSYKALGFPGADDLSHMFLMFQTPQFTEARKLKPSQELLGDSLITFDQFVQDNLETFKAM